MKTSKKQLQVRRVAPSPEQQLAIPDSSVDFARDQLKSAGRIPVQSKVASTAIPAKRRNNTGLMVGGLFLVALSFFQMGSRSNRADAAGISPSLELDGEYDMVRAGDMVGQTFEVKGESTRPNPQISALEMFFCRGRQTSTACSGKPYHPYLRWWQDWSEDPTTPLDFKEQAVREITATFGNDTYAY